MMRSLLGLVLLWPAYAWTQAKATLPERVQHVEEHQTNQDNYNSQEQTRQALANVGTKNDLAVKFDDVRVDQAAQWQMIRDNHDSMLFMQGAGFVIGVILTGASTWIIFLQNHRWAVLAAKQLVQQGERDAMDIKLKGLEASTNEVALLKELVLAAANSMSSDLAERLHHPNPEHEAADLLLEKVTTGMNDHERARLKALMEAREEDTAVGSREQKDARSLIKIMGLVDQLKNMTETKPADDPESIPNDIAQRDDL